MSYTKTNWPYTNNYPQIHLSSLINIEKGIENAHDSIDTVNDTIDTIKSSIGLSDTLYKKLEFTFNSDFITAWNSKKLCLGVNSSEPVDNTLFGFNLIIPNDWKEGTEIIPFIVFKPSMDIIKDLTSESTIGNSPIINVGISESAKVNHETNTFPPTVQTLVEGNTIEDGVTLEDDKLYSSLNILSTTNIFNLASTEGDGFSCGDLMYVRFYKPDAEYAPLYEDEEVYDALELDIYSYGIIYQSDGNGSLSPTSKIKTW